MNSGSFSCVIASLSCFFGSQPAIALSDNTFSAGVFLGDSYAPSNFRLSFGNFDLGVSDISDIYAGSRLWNENFYAGFGLGIQGSVYGTLGYEWRFVPWAGLSFEFVGSTAVSGSANGRGYIGFVAGW